MADRSHLASDLLKRSRLLSTSRVPLWQVTKSAIATVLAWFLAQFLAPGTFPIFAMIAALLVVQPSINQSVGRALERTFGVIVGVIIAYLIGVAFGSAAWIVLLAVVVSIFFAWALRLTPGSANQIPISAMLVLSIGAATPGYAYLRIIETLIGAAVGLAINFAIVPPVHLEPAKESVGALGREIAACFTRLSAALTVPHTRAQLEEMLLTARLLRPMQAKVDEAIRTATESLTFNPRAQRLRRELAGIEELAARLAPLVTRTLNMTRAVRDHYDPTLIDEPTVAAIRGELDRAAHDLRLLLPRSSEADALQTAPVEPAAETRGVPLLTAPLAISMPDPLHWVLIGSLSEDLRRVHEEIVGAD